MFTDEAVTYVQYCLCISLDSHYCIVDDDTRG
jgi:hypothetical protein